jgi:hypothetical protein
MLPGLLIQLVFDFINGGIGACFVQIPARRAAHAHRTDHFVSDAYRHAAAK